MKEELRQLLREAGDIMLSAKEIEKAVSAKEGNANFVTAYDVQVQKLLRRRLLELRPGAHFVGEEDEARDDALHGEAFIVDPIDGTTNFICHLHTSAVSVAMLREGEPVLAATYDPYRQEFYYAEKGKGATCNNQPICVSQKELKDSLVFCGTAPYYPEVADRTFLLARWLWDEALDLRRYGSAVIELCLVARGCAGLMYEMKLSPWDYAAAGLILTEAGGKISQISGEPLTYDRPCSVVAGNPKAYDTFFRKELGKF